ncbi:MAG: DUF2339 domain-containing protein, partial [Candidatus Gracilibacteria bacterium]|nr:DUF2339 domain-containing protein [Candidatus Gracilibacteria bacterium]
MINLLNRISLILSITLGFIFALLLYLLFFGGSYIGDGISYFTIFVGIIFGTIIKGMFFSHSHIIETVVEYSHKLVIKAGGKGIKDELAGKEEVRQEYRTPYFNEEEDEEENENEELEKQNTDNNSFAQRAINLNAAYTEKVQDDVDDEYIDEPKVPSEPNFIEKFFAENALAKIGGILLFLGVLFFLSLLYTSAGPVAKIIIGFITGFAFFGIGIFLDKKGYINESRTMLGVGILVNYLVILSGRYLIGEGNPIVGSSAMSINQNTTNVLTEGTTFLFLILNTVFAVVTSLLYKSKTLLLFSFVFAYLNPFLVGSAGDGTPYTLVGYSAIVSAGAMVLSYLYNNDKDEDFARYLNYVAFIGGNILLLLAPFTTVSQWLLKLIFVGIISLSSTILSYKNKDTSNIGILFAMSYIVFAILLISGGSANILHTGLAFLGYISFVLVTLGITVFLITVGSIISISYILFAPLLLIFGLLVTGSLFYIVPVIIGSLFVYLIIFSFLYELLSSTFKYIFFVLLCIFLVLSNISLKFVIPTGMDNIIHLSVVISSLIFLAAAYFFSGKEKLEYLYSVGTIGTIFLLVPIIETKGELANMSIIAIIIFALANLLLPFINRNLSLKDLKNLAISLVAGIIFIGGELYNFGEIAKLFPGVTLGYAFMGLAIIYFLLGYAMMNVLDIELNQKSLVANENKKNAIFGYLGVSISLFSIAILIMFSDKPAIVASIWFFESTILYFFYSRI